jgi:hypothetical protein
LGGLRSGFAPLASTPPPNQKCQPCDELICQLCDEHAQSLALPGWDVETDGNECFGWEVLGETGLPLLR